MNKIFTLAAVLIIFISGLAYSEEKSSEEKSSAEAFQIVNFLIKDGLNKNYFKIQEESVNLSSLQRFTLYNTNENKIAGPLALNFFLGYGIGSFYQKDIWGGIIGLSSGVLGSVLVIVGVVKFINSVDSILFLPPLSSNPEGLRLFITGCVIGGVSKIFQIVKPITFSSSYNRKLRSALNDGKLAFVPSFNFEDGTGVTIAAKLSF